MLRIKRHIRPTLHTAMKSASVDDSATVGWNLVLYAITPPVRKMHTPVNDRLVLTNVAKSESAYATAMFGWWCFRLSKSRAALLLLIFGGGPSRSFLLAVVRQ